MKHILSGIVCAGMIAGTLAAFAAPPSNKISATLFDGKGNKEVLAEATHTQRTPAPAPRQTQAQQPQSTTTTLTDGKGRAVRTTETKGDTTVVKDSHGTVVSSTTRNADGSTTTRDGRGTVRQTASAPNK